MANITIKSPNAEYAGDVAGVQFSGGSAVVDDTTSRGARVIAFAKRQGWGVSADGSQAALEPSVAQGKPIAKWTKAECTTYLTAHHVTFPASATVGDLRALVFDAYETKATGGSAVNQSAGMDSQSAIVLGGTPSDNPAKPDDAAKNAQYQYPVTASGTWAEPTISTQPSDVSVAPGADAAFTLVAVGTPDVAIQWQSRADSEGEFADVADATGDTLTVSDVSEEQSGTQVRAIVTNEAGKAVSSTATLTVTTAS